MSRTTLQAIAKERGFQANAETADLVKTLQDSHKSVCKTFALKLERMQHILTQLASWQKMISRCHITNLDLHNCGISDHEAGWLAAVQNEIGVEGAEMLGQVLTSIRARKAEKRMYNEDYSHGPCETFGQKGHGVDWLAGVLVQCPALAHLDLSYNDIEAGGAERLAGVLGQCAALAHLNLCNNRIGVGGAERLAGVLAQCPALAHLDLGFNQIGPDGAERLAGVLAQCTALAHLDLGYNDIGAAGAASLAGVLGQCTALAHLDLSSNQIGAGGAESLAGALGQCTALAHLNVGHNDIEAGGGLRASWRGQASGLVL